MTLVLYYRVMLVLTGLIIFLLSVVAHFQWLFAFMFPSIAKKNASPSDSVFNETPQLVHVEMYGVLTVCKTKLFGHLVHSRLEKIMVPSALSPLTARGHPETRLVSVSGEKVGWHTHLQPHVILICFILCIVAALLCVHACVHVGVSLAVVVVMSPVPSSHLQGECV